MTIKCVFTFFFLKYLAAPHGMQDPSSPPGIEPMPFALST